MHRFPKYAVIFACLAILYHFIRRYTAGGVCTSKARMDDKTVIITGANTGIGKETALDLAKRGAGARVIMACRDLKRGERALKDIVEKTGSTKVVVKQLDLASLKSVRKFAENINKYEPELHVLINNAGVAGLREMKKTEDGFEMIMGINHLGHFLLTNLLLDLLKKSSPSRIVVVSSITHSFTEEFKFENINSESFYDKIDAYAQSKLANILFTKELTQRLEGTKVTANSLHPGVILTEISRNFGPISRFFIDLLFFTFFKTPEQGAQTTIHLAVSEEVEGVSGLYLADCEPKEPSKPALDNEAAKKLWQVSADLVELQKTE